MSTKNDKPQAGSTEDALAMLREQDPERFAEIPSYQPIVWLATMLASLRERAGISQTKLAKSLNTTQPTISRLESGEVDPSFSRACDVLAALGHRFIIAPISDEPLVVTTSSELQQFVAEATEAIVANVHSQAMSEALVRIAEVGVHGMAAMDVPAEHSLVRSTR